MKNIVFLLAAALMVLPSCAAPPRSAATASSAAVSENLAVIIADVESAASRISAGDIGAARTLPRDIDVLSGAIDGGKLDAHGLMVARHYRGQARYLLSSLNQALGFPADRQMAGAALADFEAVANAPGQENAELRRDSLFYAGYVVMNELGEPARSVTYFQRCADMKQPGCQNIIASAKIGGSIGVKKDLPGAVALHQEAYATGLDYGCSGTHSAYSLARVAHFMGTKAEGRSALDWLRRAHRLADQAKVRAQTGDVCGGSFMSAYEYLFRLEKGERKPALLDQVVAGIEDSQLPKPLDRMQVYLGGRSDYKAFRASIDEVRDAHSRCEYAFVGLWYAALSNQKTAARSFREILQRDGQDTTCAENLAYSARYLR
ncbi:hypothetical protein [Parvibaculum sp.]|uniref:hypothetical protein n=1 Tax=Parvibaculum sp. TaxID=2024848 RepID=UPI001B28875C|nr:hypothetical protein [Parvibaculum sp.]MBO6634147.1 hypothetical protein [Parvibaculum sp.]MBO6679524.1 hypothetical protein [Parvibaculum sp.]MBO6686128.1 hypothetical protein [Parvibaculum sp.]MBO6904258.1 hypothetical protein [Parvibaculum sp.]